MNDAKLIANQFELMYHSVRANVADLTMEHSLLQPPAGGNCANWILGHLTAVQNGVMRIVGAEPVWDVARFAEPSNFFAPITSAAEAIDWDEMVERFLGSADRCVAGIGAMTDSQMAESLPDPFGGWSMRGELLALLSFHQAYHVGQLASARRLAGLDGAVRFPGQE